MIAPTLEETSTKPNSPSESSSEDLISGILGTHVTVAMPMNRNDQGSAQRARKPSCLFTFGHERF